MDLKKKEDAQESDKTYDEIVEFCGSIDDKYNQFKIDQLKNEALINDLTKLCSYDPMNSNEIIEEK